MVEINYEKLVSELVKPLTTHPDDVVATVEKADNHVHVNVTVNPDDLGRVIGKRGRVANAIRTIAHAAAMRNKETLEIEFVEE